MISDSLHYALISESREAMFSERRRAASALLELARSEDIDSLDEVLASLDGEVAPEARALAEEFGL